MEVDFQPGEVCGLEGKVEPEWECVHKSTGGNRSVSNRNVKNNLSILYSVSAYV